MATRVTPVVPNALSIDQALNACEPLVRLGQRLAAAQAHLDAVRPLLPANLQSQVRAGPVDNDGWTLLAANAGVAAKLRQLLPRLETAIAPRAGERTAIKVRIQSVR
jgi:hypothetical protein